MTDVVLCECFARDGLQHETAFVPTETKRALIERFGALGFQRIEATSFTHPANVPQFFDADEVLARIARRAGTRYKATCVNLKSVERAVAAADAGHAPDEISMVLSASPAMLKKAFNRSVDEQAAVIDAMLEKAGGRFTVVGTVSFIFGSPYDGLVPDARVVDLVRWMAGRGIRNIAIGDTMGLGDPLRIKRLFGTLTNAVPDVNYIAHFHDTRGLGIANCIAAHEAGVRCFDTAFGGAGGNPAKISYAGGFTGNVCTEDLTSAFEAMGISTGLDMGALVETAHACEQAVGRELYGRVARSGLGTVAMQEQGA